MPEPAKAGANLSAGNKPVVIIQRFAKQIGDIAGVGLAKQWKGMLPTTFIGVE